MLFCFCITNVWRELCNGLWPLMHSCQNVRVGSQQFCRLQSVLILTGLYYESVWQGRRPGICCLLLLLFCLPLQNILTGLLMRITPVRGQLQLWTLSHKGVHLWKLWLLLFFQRKIGTPPSRFPGVLGAMSVYRAKKIILMQALVVTMLMVRCYCSLHIFFAGLYFTRTLSISRIPGNTISGNMPIYLMAFI